MRESINNKIKEIKNLKKQEQLIEKEMFKEVDQLLKELISMDNWKYLIQSCREHMETYKSPMDFFNICSIQYYWDGKVNLVKGYSDGELYTVLSIDLNKTLYENIEEAHSNYLLKQKKEKQLEMDADLKIYNEIKEKYNL